VTLVSITLENVTKVFPNGRTAVRALTMDVADGELMVLVGPSGCGKSTVLRLIAGLEAPTSGRILIDGRDVTHVPPQDRDVAMVFQSYALYPHKTVAENLGFGLKMRGADRGAIDAQVRVVAEALQLVPFLDQKPAQLSGGQRLRVALGRAIVRKPKAFLLDEPLSNLDPQLRFDTRAEIGRLHHRLPSAMVHVTHDQEEAMTLGDRLAVMRDGMAEQIAPPLDVYERPANAFVAAFVGSPSMNLLPVVRQDADGASALAGDGFVLEHQSPKVNSGMSLLLGIRPRDIAVVATNDADAVARVDLVEPLGHEAVVRTRIDEGRGPEVTIVVSADRIPAHGSIVGLRFRRDRVHMFRKDDGRRVD
jgi:multiple sugar transport system ATP-binding protein